MNSVFHRLGWTPAQSAARSKLWFARNFSRPQRTFPFRRSYFNTAQHDPNRASKLKFAFRRYQQNNGLEHLHSCKPSQPLNEVNLERLKEALGGEITSIKEEQSDAGSVVTITRADPPVYQQPAFHPSGSYFNPYYNYNRNNLNQSIMYYNQMGLRNPAFQMPYSSMTNQMTMSTGYPRAFSHVDNHVMGNMTSLNQRQVPNNYYSTQLNNRNGMMTPNSINNDDMPPLVMSTGSGVSQTGLGDTDKLPIHCTNVPCSIRFTGLGQVSPAVVQPQQSMEFN